jgi:hypothetical protein
VPRLQGGGSAPRDVGAHDTGAFVAAECCLEVAIRGPDAICQAGSIVDCHADALRERLHVGCAASPIAQPGVRAAWFQERLLHPCNRGGAAIQLGLELLLDAGGHVTSTCPRSAHARRAGHADAEPPVRAHILPVGPVAVRRRLVEMPEMAVEAADENAPGSATAINLKRRTSFVLASRPTARAAAPSRFVDRLDWRSSADTI